MIYDRHWVAAVLAAVVIAFSTLVHGTEGGRSFYLPGTYNDFSAAVFGPTGLHLRNDFFAYHGEISRAPVGDRLHTDIDQRVWMNSLNFASHRLPYPGHALWSGGHSTHHALRLCRRFS
jgi:hypothetical protein